MHWEGPRTAGAPGIARCRATSFNAAVCSTAAYARKLSILHFQKGLAGPAPLDEGVAWGIPEENFGAVSSVDPLEASERIGRCISREVDNLLDGKPAAVSSEPACLARS